MVVGTGNFLSKIVSGDIDADRMDYLARDAYYTGTAYGVIDIDRIVHTVETKDVDGAKVLAYSDITAAESLLIARDLMYPTVYNHKTKLAAENMVIRATETAIKNNELKTSELISMTDFELIEFLKECNEYSKLMVERYVERKLLKVAFSTSWSELENRRRERILEIGANPKKMSRMEQELCETCDVEDGWIIIDIPPEPKIEELETKIVLNGKVENIENISPLARSLESTFKTRWEMRIYCLPEVREEVRDKAMHMFELISRQERLV